MTPDPIIKICGITRVADALHAVEEGATALGFVFWPRSPRVISCERTRDIITALPAHVTMVGVFVNESADAIRRIIEATGIDAVQLHGDEKPQDADGIDLPILKSVSLDAAAAQSSVWPDDTTLLIDVADPVRRGGTGVVVDWARAAEFARHHRVVLAGGLTPRNVEQAIRTVSPFGVDVSSGVEESPGVKDAAKVSMFLSNARRAFSAQQKRTL
jgi:phosphoribosylanthranilate isomerase